MDIDTKANTQATIDVSKCTTALRHTRISEAADASPVPGMVHICLTHHAVMPEPCAPIPVKQAAPRNAFHPTDNQLGWRRLLAAAEEKANQQRERNRRKFMARLQQLELQEGKQAAVASLQQLELQADKLAAKRIMQYDELLRFYNSLTMDEKFNCIRDQHIKWSHIQQTMPRASANVRAVTKDIAVVKLQRKEAKEAQQAPASAPQSLNNRPLALFFHDALEALASAIPAGSLLCYSSTDKDAYVVFETDKYESDHVYTATPNWNGRSSTGAETDVTICTMLQTVAGVPRGSLLYERGIHHPRPAAGSIDRAPGAEHSITRSNTRPDKAQMAQAARDCWAQNAVLKGADTKAVYKNTYQEYQASLHTKDKTKGLAAGASNDNHIDATIARDIAMEELSSKLDGGPQDYAGNAIDNKHNAMDVAAEDNPGADDGDKDFNASGQPGIISSKSARSSSSQNNHRGRRKGQRYYPYRTTASKYLN